MAIPSFNISTFSYSLPIVVKDRHKKDDLEEIKNSMAKGSVEYNELEEYIDHLNSASRDLLSNITDNLKGHGLGEEASSVTEEMIDKMILLAPATRKYNCHGWSLGSVNEINFYSVREQFIDKVSLFKKEERFNTQTDPTMHTFFATEASRLVENTISNPAEGNIAIYFKDGQITHSAKYVKTLGWYRYEKELYKDWYDSDRGFVKFDETGKVCTIESYTSKLGLGHLIAHGLEDIVPLYGAVDGFFDLVL